MRYAMAIDLQRCMGCQTCVVSCQMNNGLRPGMTRIVVEELEWGRWPEGDCSALPHSCLHCDEPRCVRVCPTGASVKGDDGIVTVDAQRCIGCGVCVTACAYGARTIPGDEAFFFKADAPAPYEALVTVPVGVADKCDFCRERLVRGEDPACVRDCPAGARLFGDIDDPYSAIARFTTEEIGSFAAGRSSFYAHSRLPLSAEEAIGECGFVPATQAVVSAACDREREPNLVVLGSAAAFTAATAVGLAAYKRRH